MQPRPPLKAARYAKSDDEFEVADGIVKAIRFSLPFMDYETARQFYAEIVPELNDRELALLGANDRFFLLTGLLDRPDAIHPWVYDRCREVEARPDGYLDLWARGHYKSTVITFAGAIQEIIADPEIRIGIFSNYKAISGPFLQQIKEELEGNDELMRIYSDVLYSNPRMQSPSWSVKNGITVKRKSNPKEATVEAHGLIEGMPTGRHFPLLVFDDVINESNVTNPEQIARCTHQIEMSDNLGVIEGTRKWFIGTRYSFADSYGVLLERGVVKPRLYPATEDGTLDGTPVMFSDEEWENRKRSQRSTIAAQMLQNPIAGQENLFRAEWLTGYQIRPAVMNVYIIGDPSGGRHKSSDRTAIVAIGIDSTGNKYLLDGYCHRMPLSERWNCLRNLWRKWKNMPGVQMVKVAWEKYGMQADHEYFEEKMRQSKTERFAVEEVNWTGEQGQQSKPRRVGRLEPDFRYGAFHVPERVYHTGVGSNCRWSISEDGSQIEYRKCPGFTLHERGCQSRGEHWRVFEPIRRLDEDKNIYDLVRVFFEEFMFFPFAPRDDLIDAMARIYDLEPNPPVIHERVEVEDYPDA